MSKPSWIFFIFFLKGFFLASSCLAAGQPEWVQQRPILADYYVGIGMAEKKGDVEDYRHRAKGDALFDLVQEISVAVSGIYIEKMIEKTGLSEQEVRSEIKLSSQARIGDHEMVAQWEDRSTLWVYYRLSKERYRQTLDHSRQAAMRAATDMWKKALAASESQQIVSALRFDCQALQQIAEFIADPLEIELDGRPQSLVNEIYAHMQRLLSNIRLSPRQANFPVLVGQASPELLPVSATFAADGREPVAIIQLPIRFAFSFRPGSPAETRYSDSEGMAGCSVGTVMAAEDGMEVKVAVDGETLFPSPGIILSALLGRLGWPQTTVRLQVFNDREDYLWHREFQDRKVTILSAYQVQGQIESWPKIYDEVLQLLKGLGAHVIAPPSMVPGESIIELARQMQSPLKASALTDTEIIIILTAQGKLNRRENLKNPAGEDIQFAGEFFTLVQKQGTTTFSDRYQAMSGWNPVGAQMCMEVAALHAFKRWKTRYLEHLLHQ